MSMMLNTVNQSATASSAATAAAAPAAPAPNAGAQPAQTAAAQPGAGQPFAAWLVDQSQAAVLAVQARLPADAAAGDAAAPASEAAPAAPAVADSAADDERAAAPLPQDGALLAAMAMPLMPLSPAQVAQAVQAAQASGAQSRTDGASPAADTPAAAAPSGSPERADTLRRSDDGRRSAAPQQAAALERGLAQAPVMQAAAPASPGQGQADAAPALRFAVHAQADANAGKGDNGAEHAAANTAPAGSTDRAAVAGMAASQPVASAPALDTVKLAGPPAAWRQSLQEALGERLNVQVGKNMEQAVIRLEPPQLGRIDIAIRHSAGTLEVNISATNGEVLRQLQTVSDNLRNDLSQRQFTEVAVTVSPAQKNSAAPFGDQQQGRGRQQGREQEENQPGRALAEASNNASVFTLTGRD
jgi:flagellar hook-length control protein FliK